MSVFQAEGDVFYYLLFCIRWASLVTQMVKNLPAIQETQVHYLVCEIP